MSPVTISPKENLILRAAARVDYLPFRVRDQINVPYGVWRALVVRGYLRRNPKGWEITEEGRALLRTRVRIRLNQRKETISMATRPRYAVSRVPSGWAIVDRHISKIRMHNDVVEILPSRDKARVKVNELNYVETKEAPATA